ncbi:MAG: 30S ribosomal protein S1, partial [Candidatus Limnocylindrales bacterium]
MTVERMDATEQADAEAPTTEDTMSEAGAETATSEPDMAAEAQPATMDAESKATDAQIADEPQQEAAAETQPEPAEASAETQPEAAALAQPETSAEGPAEQTAEAPAEATEGPETASANPQDAAEDGRPLGAADEMADMVNQAVDQMNETIAEDEAIDAPPAVDEDTTADMTAQPTDGNGAAPTEPAAETTAPVEQTATAPAGAATPPAAPAPRVYEGPEPTTMEELLAEQSTEIRSLKHGDVVEGSVVRVDKDEILVDIGAKSEGVISNRELYGRNAESQPQLSIGDVVLVYVLQPESPEGHAVLSLRRAGLERKWRSMQEQLDAGVIIEAPVIDHNKGGLIVDCGIRGFVPISQIVDFPRRPQNEQPRDAAQEIAEKLQPYVGRKLRLKILEVNRKANRLILSEKVALYEERREKRDELFSSLQVGQKVTGTVRSIAPFGVFVDLGGIDGLVHKSELSWNKVNNPEAGYRVGEEVEAEVIDINHERGRISLSIRRLQPDPWHSTVADLKVGDLIDGTVTKIVNFGSFVRVRDGLEGLIHISELSHQRVNHPGDVVHEGQTLKLKIISLDQERHRLGLSLKQAEEAPARPEPAAAAGGGAPRERRPRQERSYDMSQAVQEPEGGIDNTLAAAFAQVRQQIEETDAARGGTESDEAGDEPVATAAEPAAQPADAMVEMPSAETTATEANVEAATEADAEATATSEGMAESTAAPTAESAEADESDAKPARKGRATKGKAEPAAETATEAEPAAETATEPEPEPESQTEAAAAELAAQASVTEVEPTEAPKASDAPAEEPASDPT